MYELDAETNSLSVDTVIERDQLLEKAEELGFKVVEDEPYEPDEPEQVEEPPRSTWGNQDSGEYDNPDDDGCVDSDFDTDEEISSGGTFDGELFTIYCNHNL